MNAIRPQHIRNEQTFIDLKMHGFLWDNQENDLFSRTDFSNENIFDTLDFDDNE